MAHAAICTKLKVYKPSILRSEGDHPASISSKLNGHCADGGLRLLCPRKVRKAQSAHNPFSQLGKSQECISSIWYERALLTWRDRLYFRGM